MILSRQIVERGIISRAVHRWISLSLLSERRLFEATNIYRLTYYIPARKLLAELITWRPVPRASSQRVRVMGLTRWGYGRICPRWTQTVDWDGLRARRRGVDRIGKPKAGRISNATSRIYRFTRACTCRLTNQSPAALYEAYQIPYVS